jgi:hypothetical protein
VITALDRTQNKVSYTTAMRSARLADDKRNMLFKVTEKRDEYPQQLQDGDTQHMPERYLIISLFII